MNCSSPYTSTPEPHASQHVSVLSYLFALVLPAMWMALTHTILPCVVHWARSKLVEMAVYREVTTICVSDAQMKRFNLTQGRGENLYRDVFTNEELVKIVLRYMDHRAEQIDEDDTNAVVGAAATHQSSHEMTTSASDTSVKGHWLLRAFLSCVQRILCAVRCACFVRGLTHRQFSHTVSRVCDVAELQLDIRAVSTQDVHAKQKHARIKSATTPAALASLHGGVELSHNSCSKDRAAPTTHLGAGARSYECVFYTPAPVSPDALGESRAPWLQHTLTSYPPSQYRARIAPGLHARFVHDCVKYSDYGGPGDGKNSRTAENEDAGTSHSAYHSGKGDTSSNDSRNEMRIKEGTALRQWLTQAAARRHGRGSSGVALAGGKDLQRCDVDLQAWRRCRHRRRGGRDHADEKGVVYVDATPLTRAWRHENSRHGYAQLDGMRGAWRAKDSDDGNVDDCLHANDYVDDDECGSSSSEPDTGSASRGRGADVDILSPSVWRRKERFTREEKLIFGGMLADLGEGGSFGPPQGSTPSCLRNGNALRSRALGATLHAVKQDLMCHPAEVESGESDDDFTTFTPREWSFTANNDSYDYSDQDAWSSMPSAEEMTEDGEGCEQNRAPRRHAKHVMQRQVIFEYHEAVWRRLGRWFWGHTWWRGKECSATSGSNNSTACKRDEQEEQQQACESVVDNFIENAVAWHRAQYSHASTERTRYIYIPNVNSGTRRHGSATQQQQQQQSMSVAASGRRVARRVTRKILHQQNVCSCRDSSSSEDEEEDEDEDEDEDLEDTPYLVVICHPLCRGGQSSSALDALYFPHKARLMQLLHDFAHRRGKYAVVGMSHSLTLLIHGPSGTGKTALAKAIAQWLKRDVVVLPCEERAVMQNLSWYVKGSTRLVRCNYIHRSSSSSDCDSLGVNEKMVLIPQYYRSFYTRDLAAHEAVYLMESVDALSEAGCGDRSGCGSNISSRYDVGKRDRHKLTSQAIRALRHHSAPAGRVIILTARDIDAVPQALRHCSVTTHTLRLQSLNPHTALAMAEHFFGGQSLPPGQRMRALSVLSSAYSTATCSAWLPDRWWHMCADYGSLEELLEALTRDAMAGRPLIREDVF